MIQPIHIAAMILFAVMLSLLGVICWIEWWLAQPLTPKKRAPMTSYTFKLYRRVRNRRHPATVIISAFNLIRACDDPFVERIRLAKEFPQWAIATDFTSATDEAYDLTIARKTWQNLRDMLFEQIRDTPDTEISE